MFIKQARKQPHRLPWCEKCGSEDVRAEALPSVRSRKFSFFGFMTRLILCWPLLLLPGRTETVYRRAIVCNRCGEMRVVK